MNYKNINITASLVMILIILFSGCRRKNDDDIELSDLKKPVAFVFANTNSVTSGEFAQPILRRSMSNKVAGINGSKMTFLSFYPEDTDPLYSRIGESLKKYYSNDEGFNYPTFIADGVNYGIDTTEFYNRISSGIDEKADVSLGQRLELSNKDLNIKVKLRYAKDVSYDHSLAVYVFFKKFTEAQRISSGTDNFYLHNNVVRTSVTSNLGMDLQPADKDAEREYEFSYNIEDFLIENIGVAVVVFKKNDGEIIDVINSVRN